MYSVPSEILEKHKIGIEAARAYWVLGQPTGFSDDYFTNVLEANARADGLELRDYVQQEIQGTRSQNADYIGKVEKIQIPGSMLQAVHDFEMDWRTNTGTSLYWIPKYDGSSLAAYYDVNTGHCIRVVTIGGTNLGSEGIDQTEKFAKFYPELPGTGIRAVQTECLVSLEHGFGENSRQKANGLVNSSYEPLPQGTKTDKEYERYLKGFKENFNKVKSEVSSYINLRCFRYFRDPSYTNPIDYKDGITGLPLMTNPDGDIKFCGGYVMTYEELCALGPDIVEKDIWSTPSGTFMVDGLVAYTKDGVCVKALKYKDAGRGEATTVKSIKWNDQSKKGKDSWSANAIIDPIEIRGSKITKPTVGSIKKMVQEGISPGAKVTLILANSTIPAISKVLKAGDGNYGWPTCECGYTMSEKDIYGALLKCGNLCCTKRYNRMVEYLSGITDLQDLDLDKLLILDRVKLCSKPNYGVIIEGIQNSLNNGTFNVAAFYGMVSSLLTTSLQLSNLELVCEPATNALIGWYNGHK